MSERHEPMEAHPDIELIQQWQYLGRVHPKMLEDGAFEACRKAGLTSVQSYLYWAEIEKSEEDIDFSSYDELVEKLKQHGLKWVPFLILGPRYSVPDWFHASEESVYARCLEHGLESKVQSIWNPHLPRWVDRFLKMVAEHYRDSGVLEAITLGISGNWGESIYPAHGGFTKFHTHLGWWCGDEHARESFQRFVSDRYHTVKEVNRAWGTRFSDMSEVCYPPLRYTTVLFFLNRALQRLPTWLLRVAEPLWRRWGLALSSPSPLSVLGRGREAWWLDFVQWYVDSMTRWAEFWVSCARKHFPDTEIYLVSGGMGEPMLGADFSAQVAMLSRYGAGMRITNQNDDYGESFIATRLVSTAARFYQSYFTTEEGGINSADGITMRIFDAATSGAKGAYFKSVIGTGRDTCTGREHPVGEPTRGADNLRRYRHILTRELPIIDVAVLYPNTSIYLDPRLIHSVYRQCSLLRDVVDLDLVDERMVVDGALRRYRFLVLLEGKRLKESTLESIESWIEDGGVLITRKGLAHAPMQGASDGLSQRGEGHVLALRASGCEYLRQVARAVHNTSRSYPWQGVAAIDIEWDGVYASLFERRVLYYNSNQHPVKKRGEIGGRTIEVEVPPLSIASVPL
ncbi:MAG: hypothetical protein PWR26_1393 [Methanosarcinales archaeon]|uniref:family 14 glycosylhydrolase n=1 Tax=Methermicoccus shengliensis TaxID=660064 RepID=UPI0005B29038|nr:family 14 glycosylhydrolase [Methermicoccus shengliensis]MDI3488676.1 hypothetical protein [Methanosarcinales archaeon]MDN5295785.1 hypothetical protein [Methanosarcinales archaeon]